jgi:acetylornithine deacetylase/succinyl-diaminopimelate desuccinylase-like protein
MIRNRCVNDGTPQSGGETRSADLLHDYLDCGELAIERFEPEPGRGSILARTGSDPDRPTLLYVGHTDVVPASSSGWTVDPFGGELIDGVVWGRGAVDMLSMTASMAVALRALSERAEELSVNVGFLGVADEEAGGRFGSRWLVENHPDCVAADWVITESGGFPFQRGGRTKLELFTGEKGAARCSVSVRGRSGHAAYTAPGSNALVRAGAVLQALAEHQAIAHISPTWRTYVDEMFDPEIADRLVDAAEVSRACADAGDFAEHAFASTHMTMAPTILRGEFKGNVVPAHVEIVLDVRTLPGQTAADAVELIEESLGCHKEYSEVRIVSESLPSESQIDDRIHRPLLDAVRATYPDADLVPSLMTAATDARFFRGLGSQAYGFGLYSGAIDPMQYFAMIHGVDERVDVESVGLMVDLWTSLGLNAGGGE